MKPGDYVLCFSDADRVNYVGVGRVVNVTDTAREICHCEIEENGKYRKESVYHCMTGFLDSSIMWFGKHKGKSLENVPAGYLIWLLDEIKTHGNDFTGKSENIKRLISYIEDNMSLLVREAQEK